MIIVEGIKDLLRIPVGIKRFIKRNTAGDEEYEQDLIDATCYAEEKFKIIVDDKGREVVSSMTFYIDGSYTVFNEDILVYNGGDYTDNGKEYSIKALTTVREIDGSVALLVVYA